jgi:hypothetical protein
MLPLFRKDFPDSKDELGQAIRESLLGLLPKSNPLVAVRSRVSPYLDEIAINLDGAEVDSLPPKPASLVGETKSAFDAAAITLSGRKVSVRGIPMNLRAEALDVVLHKGTDENGGAILVMKRVRDGHIVISIPQLELEEAIAKIGGRVAKKYGITIEQVRLAMRARGRRSLCADIRIQARKLLLRAKIEIYGQVDVDEDFVAKLSQFKCKSDGAIGSVACNALNPLFERINGQTFSLKSIQPAGIQLRDMHVAVADTVEVTVDFGSSE